MRRKKTKFIIGSCVIVIIIGYLVYTGMKGSSLYYMTVSELVARGSGLYEEGVRISGDVQTGSVHWDSDSLNLRFVMTDGKESVDVAYRGGLPDMFQEGAPVVIEGQYSSTGIFHATQLLAKCPSKYEPVASEESK
jgi:cytochrome c-type biogenesis protein CcmE